MKKAFYLPLILGLAGCEEKPIGNPNNYLVSSDFEAMEGWVPEPVPASLVRDKAHSGRYAVKVDANNEFSIGYNNTLGRLSASKLKKIRVHAWVNLPDKNSQAILVAQVLDPADPTKTLVWEGLKLGEKVTTYNKWVEVALDVTLPPTVSYTNRIAVYLWRANGQGATFMDDLAIEKVE